MMYRLSPKAVAHIINSLEVSKEMLQCTDSKDMLNDEIETFKSIQAVMVASNQDYVYIVGRNPNKI